MMICAKTVPISTESIKRIHRCQELGNAVFVWVSVLEQLTDENANLRDENTMLRDEVSQLRSKLADIG